MPERKQRDTSKKRNSILDAAIQAFQDEGYDNTSMDRIAEVAGASKRTVYNHFASKEMLFEAVVKRFMEQASELKRIPYDPKRSLEEQLKEFAAAKLSIFSNPSWMGMLKVALGVFIRDPKLAEKTMAQAKAGEGHLEHWLQEAVKDGKLHIKDFGLAAEIFWGMVSGVLFWPQLLLGQLMDDKCMARLQDEIIRMFLNYYQKD